MARHIAEAAERSGLLRDFPHVDGIVPITHTSGCGMAGSGEGFEILKRTLWGTAANANFGAILLVGLGCEVLQVDRLKKDYGIADGPAFQSFTIQDVGGTRRAHRRRAGPAEGDPACDQRGAPHAGAGGRTDPRPAMRRLGRVGRASPPIRRWAMPRTGWRRWAAR
ncbi:MAG: UxaA family hydrolase [Rhizomicrobium sp.]